MCEPVSLTIGAMAIAGAGIAVQDEQRKSGNKLKQEAADLQTRVFQNKSAQINQQFAGEQIRTSEEIQQIRIDAMQKRATSQVNASASNVTGLSVDAVLADFDRQEGRATSSSRRQLELTESSTNLNIEATHLGTEGAMFNLRPEAFNPAAAALQIGSAGFSAFTGAGGFKSTKVPEPTPTP